MDKHTFTLPARVLHALAPFASSERIPGILIERSAGLYASTVCVATNGCQLLAVQLRTTGSAAPFTCVLPSHVGARPHTVADVHFQLHGTRYSTDVEADGGLLSQIPYAYPDWRRVVPKTEPYPRPCWQLDLGYLHGFAQALARLSPEAPGAQITAHPGGAYVIRQDDEREGGLSILGVQMGIVWKGEDGRPSDWTVPTLPDWAKATA